MAAAVGLALLPQAGVGAEVSDLKLRRVPQGLEVGFRLSGAITSEVEQRLAGGAEVSFEFAVRLRRRRANFVDRTVAERFVTTSVKYSNLTRMYTLTRQVDAPVLAADATDDRQVALEWLTVVSELALFDTRDLREPGTYYLKVRAKLRSGYRAVVVPWDEETDWVESERFVVGEERP